MASAVARGMLAINIFHHREALLWTSSVGGYNQSVSFLLFQYTLADNPFKYGVNIVATLTHFNCIAHICCKGCGGAAFSSQTTCFLSADLHISSNTLGHSTAQWLGFQSAWNLIELLRLLFLRTALTQWQVYRELLSLSQSIYGPITYRENSQFPWKEPRKLLAQSDQKLKIQVVAAVLSVLQSALVKQGLTAALQHCRQSSQLPACTTQSLYSSSRQLQLQNYQGEIR